MRWLALASQAVLLGVAWATGERPLAVTILSAGLSLLEILRRLLIGESGAARAHALWDWFGLTALLTAWGEPHQPLSVFYLVDGALIATFSGRRAAWIACALAIAGQSIASLLPVALGTAAHSDPAVHLLAHTATFSLSAAALAHFLGGVSEASEEARRALREASEREERSARLAAIGTLAAGVAHELATPLGSIGLLAEEIPHDPAAMVLLRGELARCRSILDRMLARPSPSEGRTEDLASELASWIDAWRRAHAGLSLSVDLGAGERAAVRGSAEGWRAALWTALDNAALAGPPIAVTLGHTETTLVLTIEDSGPGIDPEIAARIGEPFLSRWPSGQGAGLGLYVARTFARGTGGDLRLEPAPSGGCRAVLAMPREVLRYAEEAQT